MNTPQTPSPRGRLQELLAIPERERTDAEWDEINELEIAQALGNRDLPTERGPGPRPNRPPSTGQPNSGGGNPQGNPQGNPRGNPRGQNPSRKFHKRPPKRKAP